jgi:hypothetical protein
MNKKMECKHNAAIHFLVISLRQILFCRYCTPLAINRRRDNATCITGTLAAWKKAPNGNVLQCLAITHNAHGRRGACLHANHCRLACEEAARHAAELLKAALQAG